MVLHDRHIGGLLASLEEAARADQQTTLRFVPPRAGIVDVVSARRHQFVLGRRGVGKSTLLHVAEATSTERGSAVAFVDLETLRGIPYPDVLIQLLIQVLAALRDRLGAMERRRSIGAWWGLTLLKFEIRRLEHDLTSLLAAPQEMEKTVTRLKKKSSSRKGTK
jgi:hypothetical protein